MEQSGDSIFPVEDALEMILTFDETGRISYANAEAEKNLEYEEGLRGKNISLIFPDIFRIRGERLEMDASYDRRLRKLVAYRQNRTCFPVDAKIMENGAGGGNYICMANVTVEREYLSRKNTQAEQEVQQAMKVKSEFVANVTHELRTPVNGVLGHVRELLEEETDDKKLKTLHVIERCCDDMNKIINNILDFSKLEAGKFVLEERKFHVRDMLDYVKANHIPKITEKGLEFFMTVSPEVPEYIVGDELRIAQILNNLLSNALKFTTVGKITVQVLKTAQVNGRVELFFLVIDSGIGIEPKDRDKLFQSFSQVDASISRRYGGTGLGLNICKQLVELMGGSIGVESEKNKGSAFSFSIWAGLDGEEGQSSMEGNAEEEFSSADSLADAQQLLHFWDEEEGQDDVKKYGTPENKEALEKNLSKLVLCVEMGNWEKAEMFMETIRQLMEDAPREAARAALRLKMAVQKENYEKATAGYEELKAFL
ncbi:MAG: ATP-binding protein [Clostridium sp.]|nr:ATP-binding protein [Clostridium sp.]